MSPLLPEAIERGHTAKELPSSSVLAQILPDAEVRHKLLTGLIIERTPTDAEHLHPPRGNEDAGSATGNTDSETRTQQVARTHPSEYARYEAGGTAYDLLFAVARAQDWLPPQDVLEQILSRLLADALHPHVKVSLDTGSKNRYSWFVRRGAIWCPVFLAPDRNYLDEDGDRSQKHFLQGFCAIANAILDLAGSIATSNRRTRNEGAHNRESPKKAPEYWERAVEDIRLLPWEQRPLSLRPEAQLKMRFPEEGTPRPDFVIASKAAHTRPQTQREVYVEECLPGQAQCDDAGMAFRHARARALLDVVALNALILGTGDVCSVV